MSLLIRLNMVFIIAFAVVGLIANEACASLQQRQCVGRTPKQADRLETAAATAPAAEVDSEDRQRFLQVPL